MDELEGIHDIKTVKNFYVILKNYTKAELILIWIWIPYVFSSEELLASTPVPSLLFPDPHSSFLFTDL